MALLATIRTLGIVFKIEGLVWFLKLTVEDPMLVFTQKKCFKILHTDWNLNLKF